MPKRWIGGNKPAFGLPLIPKVDVPKQLADFRPISIIPVLTRIMERTVVTQFLYPAYLEPSIFSDLSDQFAFRPTGSTTGAIVSILHSVTHHLLSNSYIVVMSLDFSKAFDTVRRSALLQKLARLDMPDQVYN